MRTKAEWEKAEKLARINIGDYTYINGEKRYIVMTDLDKLEIGVVTQEQWDKSDYNFEVIRDF